MAELTALGKQSAAEQDQDDDGVNDLFDEATVEGVSVKTPLPPQPLPAAPSVEPLVARPVSPRTLTLTLTLTLALALALALTLTLTLTLTLALTPTPTPTPAALPRHRRGGGGGALAAALLRSRPARRSRGQPPGCAAPLTTPQSGVAPLTAPSTPFRRELTAAREHGAAAARATPLPPRGPVPTHHLQDRPGALA